VSQACNTSCSCHGDRRVSGGPTAKTSINSLPLPLETATGALPAASRTTVERRIATCAPLAPFPFPSPARTPTSPLLRKTDDNSMTRRGCPRNDVTRHSLVATDESLPRDWWCNLWRAWLSLPSLPLSSFCRSRGSALRYVASPRGSLRGPLVSGGCGTARKGVEAQGTSYPQGDTLALQYEQYL
jgi:hypothetical protein